MKNVEKFRFEIQVSMEVERLRRVKVRSYERIRNGKLEKIRSYYRWQ